jgi:uncharacterized protein YndB with AHSA1/START domain
VHEEQAMKAITKLLAGGVAIAALASAAPAAAQYYPGYGYGGGDIIGSIINSVAGGGMGYGSPYGYGQPGYGANSQVAVNQCANAVQMRLSGAYGGGYGGYGGYGYNSYGAPGAGCVLEVVEGERFVWTSALGPGYRPAELGEGCESFPFTAVITLADAGNGKTLYRAVALHKNAADKETHEKMGFQEGWGTCASQLEEFAQSLSARA